MIIDIIKIVFTNHHPDHSQQKESYTEELHKEGIVSSRGPPGYLILVIRRNGRNIVHDTIFLHTTTLTKEVPFIHLLLILRLQFLLLSNEPNL